jgi:peptidoglycan hydrolase-like protein with peptidoglycan-binding domain
MARPYTGFDAIAGGKRAGMETLLSLLSAHFGLWNNGSFGVRKKRGKSSYSVHATGRAADLSWRGAPYRGPGNYEAACKMMDFVVAHADALHIEAVFDYYPAPHGRGWKCDRAAWQVYDKPAFSGAPGGDWVHIEISNDKADDPAYYTEIMRQLLGEPPVAVKPAPAAKTPKAPPGKKPWLQVGSKGNEVKAMQKIVGAEPVDGSFGAKTEAKVKEWQAEHDQHVDGIWGPGSDKHAKNCTCKPADAKAEDATPAKVTTKKAATKPAKKPAATSTATATKASRPYPGAPIRKGSTGPNVKLVQGVVGTELVDGQFGSKTLAAVKKWQSENGQLADGIVGPKTWAAMFG